MHHNLPILGDMSWWKENQVLLGSLIRKMTRFSPKRSFQRIWVQRSLYGGKEGSGLRNRKAKGGVCMSSCRVSLAFRGCFIFSLVETFLLLQRTFLS
jgi:hypothetical protein